MGDTSALVEPTDLGLRIGTEKEVWLEKVRKALSDELRNCEYTAELNREFLKVINKKILKEKEMLK